jgi:hypothetical protein
MITGIGLRPVRIALPVQGGRMMFNRCRDDRFSDSQVIATRGSSLLPPF